MKYKDLRLYKDLHLKSPIYGTSGSAYADAVFKYIKKTNSKSILDFGCGKGHLSLNLKKLGFDIDEYDPAIEGKNKIKKKQYDLIITTDVLEHLHEDEVEYIIKDFIKLKPKHMFHAISTRPAAQILSDGTNAHKTIKSGSWWADVFKKYTEHNVDLHVNPPFIKHSDIALIYTSLK